ncbi:MAG: hypothetical protein WD060_10735 [Pirellulales bacterium]
MSGVSLRLGSSPALVENLVERTLRPDGQFTQSQPKQDLKPLLPLDGCISKSVGDGVVDRYGNRGSSYRLKFTESTDLGR